MIVEKKPGGDAVERASVFLRNEFRIQGLSIGDRVPSPKILARKAGVSTQAMCRAMGRLKDQGMITITRSGTFRGPPTEALPRHPATGRKWERVKEKIRGDIYSGVHPEGQNLPETAELMKQYGVSRPTLRKTLEALVEEGALVSSRRDFRVPSVRAETSHACVLSISLEGMDDRPDLISEWAQQFTSNLLSQCRNHRVHMKGLGYKPQKPHAVFQDELRAALERESPIGYVVWSRAIPRERLLKILQDLQPKKRPLAMLDDEGTLELPTNLSENLRFKLFSIGTEQAGQEAARLLLKRGHRKAAFFSAFHAHPWSQRRLATFQREFAAVNGQVVVYARNEIEYLNQYAFALLDTDPSAFEAIERETSKAFASEVIDQYKVLRERNLFQDVPAVKKAEGRALLEILEEARRRKIDPNLFLSLKNHIYAHAAEVGCRLHMEPLFRQALREKDITAWVGANDQVTQSAIDFLSGIGRSERNALAVMGFDNTSVAFQHDFTSFDFDFPQIAVRILRYLLRPSDFEKTGPRISVPGFMVNRTLMR